MRYQKTYYLNQKKYDDVLKDLIDELIPLNIKEKLANLASDYLFIVPHQY